MCPQCRWAWRRPVPMSVEAMRAHSAILDQSQCWAGLSAHGIGAYLLSIGTLCALERAHPQTACWWDGGLMLRVNLPAEDLYAALDEVATACQWRADTGATKHLAFMAVGRRKPADYIAPARELLAIMDAAQRRAELLCVVANGPPVRLQFPPRWSAKSYCWSLQTVYPECMKTAQSPFPPLLSAWHAALVGESRAWLCDALAIEEFQRTPGWTRNGALGDWLLPVWHEPMEIRRARIFFRPRGRHSGASWSRWLRTCGRPEASWLKYRLSESTGRVYVIFGPEREKL
jgi:hypothetical protein